MTSKFKFTDLTKGFVSTMPKEPKKVNKYKDSHEDNRPTREGSFILDKELTGTKAHKIFLLKPKFKNIKAQRNYNCKFKEFFDYREAHEGKHIALRGADPQYSYNSLVYKDDDIVIRGGSSILMLNNNNQVSLFNSGIGFRIKVQKMFDTRGERYFVWEKYGCKFIVNYHSCYKPDPLKEKKPYRDRRKEFLDKKREKIAKDIFKSFIELKDQRCTLQNRKADPIEISDEDLKNVFNDAFNGVSGFIDDIFKLGDYRDRDYYDKKKELLKQVSDSIQGSD